MQSITHFTKQLLIQGHDPDAARFLIKPEDNARSLTRLISQNRLAGLRDIVRAAPPRSEATCFHTLLAGSGHLQVWLFFPVPIFCVACPSAAL